MKFHKSFLYNDIGLLQRIIVYFIASLFVSRGLFHGFPSRLPPGKKYPARFHLSQIPRLLRLSKSDRRVVKAGSEREARLFLPACKVALIVVRVHATSHLEREALCERQL